MPDNFVDYNKKNYIEKLYKLQKSRPEYATLSDLQQKIIEQHFNESYHGLQNLSYLSTYECARRLGVSNYECKIAHQQLRAMDFIVITDILENGRRPNYGYVHQIKDLSLDYYYDYFHPKTFKRQVYISKMIKGKLHRNILAESKTNRELRLRGEKFEALGVELTVKQKEKLKEKFEACQQRFNPRYGEVVEDENSVEIAEKNAEYNFFEGVTLVEDKSIGLVDSCSVVNVDERIKKPAKPKIKVKKEKTSILRIPTEYAFYKKNEKSQSSILNPLISQINRDWSQVSYDTNGNPLTLISKKILDVVAHAYVDLSWNNSDKFLMQNWSHEMTWEMIKDLDWRNFNSVFDKGKTMYWLEAQGFMVQKGNFKQPIYDKYFPSDNMKENGMHKLGRWTRIKNIKDENDWEFGVNLSGTNYVCLDFDSEKSYRDFIHKYPELGNSLTLKTEHGYHLYLYCHRGFKKYITNRRSLFGIPVDAKSSGFVKFSRNEMYNSARPMIMPYDIFREWGKDIFDAVEALRRGEEICFPEKECRKGLKSFEDKLKYVSDKVYEIGSRRVESWKDLRGLRHGLSYDEYMYLAERMYLSFDQASDVYYTKKQHMYNVNRAWNKADKVGFVKVN